MPPLGKWRGLASRVWRPSCSRGPSGNAAFPRCQGPARRSARWGHAVRAGERVPAVSNVGSNALEDVPSGGRVGGSTRGMASGRASSSNRPSSNVGSNIRSPTLSAPHFRRRRPCVNVG
eukprot:8999688-Pyramimonas_sp.AAC.1